MSTTYQMVIRASRKLGFAALFVGFASWAAAHNVTKQHIALKRVDQAWILTSGGNPLTAGDYELATTEDLQSCSGTAQICGIVAPNDGSDHPVISSSLQNRISNKNTSMQDVFLRN